MNEDEEIGDVHSSFLSGDTADATAYFSIEEAPREERCISRGRPTKSDSIQVAISILPAIHNKYRSAVYVTFTINERNPEKLRPRN